jgi:hypothetical protein
MAAGLAVGTIALAISNLASSLQMDAGWLVAVDVLILLGWITFAGALISATRAEETEVLPSAVAEAQDLYYRGRAYTFGFVAMMATQVLILLGDAYLIQTAGATLDVGFVATFSMGVGLLFSLLRYIQLNRHP